MSPFLMALVAVVCWSTVATAFKISLRTLSYSQLLSLSSLFAFLILFCFLCLQKKTRGFFTGFRKIHFLLALLNPFFYYLVLFRAYECLPAQQAQALNYTWPVVLSLLLILKSSRLPTAKILVSYLLSLVGIFMVSVKDFQKLEFDEPTGIFLALFSSLVFATYWVLLKRLQEDELVTLTRVFFLSSIFMGFLGLYPMNPDFEAVVGSFYVGAMEMAIPFFFWNRAMRLSPNPQVLSLLAYLSPCISLVWIYFLLGESIRQGAVFGLGLIISSVVLGSSRTTQV